MKSWFAALTALALSACDAPAPDAFVRFVIEDEAAQRGRLETAIVRYEDSRGRRVDLVATLHIGEQRYYDELDERLDDYDLVLYEHIGDVSARDVGETVRTLAEDLGVVAQIEAIDYTAPNRVQADLTEEEFFDLSDGRTPAELAGITDAKNLDDLILPPSEHAIRPIVNIDADGRVSRQGQVVYDPNVDGSDMSGVESLLEEARRPAKPTSEADPQVHPPASLATVSPLLFEHVGKTRESRFVFSREIGDLDRWLERMSSEWHEIVILARNQAAMRVLERALEGSDREFAVLYGAAHMADFDVRLRERLGFRRVATRWVEAWRVD